MGLIGNYTYSFSKEIPVAEITFGAITVGPLVFIPILTVYVGIDGSLSAGITASVTQNTWLEVGVQYSSGDWSPIHNFTSGFGYRLPELSTLSAQAQIYAKPQFDLLLYGITGPYANIKGYFDLEMYPLNDPWLTLWAGLQAGVGVTAKVFGKTLVNYGLTLPDYREKIVELAGNRPPSITSLTASPQSVFTLEASTVTVSVSDPEGNPIVHLVSDWGKLVLNDWLWFCHLDSPRNSWDVFCFGQRCGQLARAQSGIRIGHNRCIA